MNRAERTPPRTVRVVALADTHGHLMRDIPDGDLLIHAGDACGDGTRGDVERFCEWFESLPHPHKVYVPGNHDRFMETDLETARSLLPTTTLLIGQSVEVCGLTIWGGPWTPGDGRWAWASLSREEARNRWSSLAGAQIVVTHGPPRGILDRIWRRWRPFSLGCPELRKAVARCRPQLHVFGHIHEYAGRQKVVKGVRYVNASIRDEHYKVVNAPTVLDVEAGA